MSSRAHRTLLAVALALPLAVSGCGDDDGPGGLDRNNPEAVARAYVETYYDCGDRGAGLRWDLQFHDGGEQSRAETIAGETRQGCRPARVPKVQAFLGGSRGDLTEVQILNEDACDAERATLLLVRIDAGWKVDPGERDADEVSCVRSGSK